MPVDLDRLASTPPEIRVLRAGAILYRVYFRAGEYAREWHRFRDWGPHPQCGFDHHEGPEPHAQDRRILYAAELPYTALVEVFDEAGAIHRTRDAPALVQFAPVMDLRLLDLTDAWIRRAGGKPAEVLKEEREISREWARAIWTAYGSLHGICYRSLPAPAHFNVALFERAEEAVAKVPAYDLSLTHPGIASIVARAAHDFALDLI